MLLAELHSMFYLVVVRIQRYVQQCSSITHVRQFLSRAIELLIRLTRHFRNPRAQGDEEKASETTYEARSLRPAGEYICASQLPRSSSPETRPSEPCSPSDTPYDAPVHLVIPQTPKPTRKQTSSELMSSPEHLTVPAPAEVREPLPNRTPNPASPTAAARPPIFVNTKLNRGFTIGYPDLSPTRTPVSPEDYVRPTLIRAATFGGSSDDPLFATRAFLNPRRHTLAVPNSPEHETISRPSSAQSNVSLGRNHSNMSLGRGSYRKHDGQAPRPHSPTPSIYEGSNMCAISSATLAAALAASETDGSQVPFAPRPSSSDHAYSRETTGPRFAPMSANGVKRFDRHSRGFAMIDPSISDYKIKAYQVHYPNHDGELPIGWTAYVHPEGARYFLQPQTRTYTESDVCSPEILNDIVYFSNYLHHELRVAIDTKKLNIDVDYDEVELVLEPKKTLDQETEIICCYYFVNPAERCLFWLDEYDAEDMLGECRGVTALSHKRLAVQAQYWKHWEMFPNLCIITREILDELKELMLHATCDHLTTTRSAAALSADELKQYFEIVKFIRVETTVDRAHSVVILGRIMYTFCRNQYLNFHGQPCARLSVDQTVRGWSYKPSIYMTIFAPLLCMAPVAHVRSLHTSFVDDLASTAEWKIFITRLNGQLQNLNLLGTVLLGANVGFLAIESVDVGAGRSATQIASYMSLVLSFGSIALGLTFIALDLTGRERGSEAARFLQRMNDGKHGLEKLAIIYSLPYALLMWSMLLFIIAFSYEWCSPGDAVSRATVGTVLLIVCGLIVWCISVASDKRAPWWWKSDQLQDVGKTSKETHLRKHSRRKSLAARLRGWFATTKNRVSVASVRSAHNGPPPLVRGVTRTSVPLINFRRATVSRQAPPKITVTTRPDSGEVNGVPRTPSEAGVGYQCE
ncbi:hypothetical protein K503DRAFT_743802 [Rhizopogon vinicolor AM-OR11-026]|uniref:WW domain-containing protein n=1 Tax=Rhizopogon vinicolor AM-OR11-026 TaxID=1314800 RepID=A0A1B7MVY8_9AGAM|nr:hypothetical protein K503DRAFT_743802 [Rhizopogon vinicolor AM-OR11-026]